MSLLRMQPEPGKHRQLQDGLLASGVPMCNRLGMKSQDITRPSEISSGYHALRLEQRAHCTTPDSLLMLSGDPVSELTQLLRKLAGQVPCRTWHQLLSGTCATRSKLSLGSLILETLAISSQKTRVIGVVCSTRELKLKTATCVYGGTPAGLENGETKVTQGPWKQLARQPRNLNFCFRRLYIVPLLRILNASR